jgi:hypothetical protein
MAVRPPTDTILRKDAPITIIYRTFDKPLLLHTFVTSRNGNGETIEVQLPRTIESLRLEDEGVEWVRGHWMLDARIVAAALTARALR